VSLTALARACHPGPTVAVTLLAVLLAVRADLTAATVVALGAAVLAGQLVIGWTNDVVDAGRDRRVGRGDKPVATGEVSARTVVTAAAVAFVACVGLSASLGWRAGLCHVVLLVGSGLAYDLGVKATVWSWLPYAVAFGSLPAVPTLAQDPPVLPAWWAMAAGAALGVGAHLVNVLPDLEDDAATGVRGLPHRLGGRVSQVGAAVLLLGASVALVLGPGSGSRPTWAPAALVLTTGLAVAVAVTRGRTPFKLAVLMALVDVVLLTTTTHASRPGR
jgi:4-hydroxybenzoate polyprenyltransferase